MEKKKKEKIKLGKWKYQEGKNRRELRRRKKKGSLEKLGYEEKNGNIVEKISRNKWRNNQREQMKKREREWARERGEYGGSR